MIQYLPRKWRPKAILAASEFRWRQAGFSMPAPQSVKMSVLKRYAYDSPQWIESGTFQGSTTAVLESWGGTVFTIEPEPTLAAAAKERFDSSVKVTVCEGLSEQVLPTLLATLNGEMALWLDGHFSSGVTHEGPTVTPILAELSAVADSVHRFEKITVFIDDVRVLFSSNNDATDYPPVGSLVNWAESNGLSWQIEQDIFVAASG